MLVQFSRLEFVNVGAILNGFLLEEFSGKCLATERVSQEAESSGDFMALEGLEKVLLGDGFWAIRMRGSIEITDGVEDGAAVGVVGVVDGGGGHRGHYLGFVKVEDNFSKLFQEEWKVQGGKAGVGVIKVGGGDGLRAKAIISRVVVGGSVGRALLEELSLIHI